MTDFSSISFHIECIHSSAICKTDYEANEQIKKLSCGHLFHATCVANWLLSTGICPVCRQRI